MPKRTASKVLAGAGATLVALIGSASPSAASPAAGGPGPSLRSAPPTTTAKLPAPLAVALPAPTLAAILVDVDTGRVLFEDNAHEPLPPGSLTKTLTAMIAADWLPADAEVPVTAVAADVYPDKVGMQPGQRWPLGIVLHSLITDSANDAAYALAVDIGGSLAGFAPIMTEAAEQIGLSDHPVLEDPAGLDGSEGFDNGNRISAWDLSIMGRDMMANPELAAIADQETYDFEGPDGIAYHLVSRNYHFLATYPGAIGVKTGFTDAAGYCDTEEAERGGRKMLAVVLNSSNPDADAATLITAGFGVAVAAEGSDPRLPPVVEPYPPAPPAPPATVRPGGVHRVATAASTRRRAASGEDALIDALAIAAVVFGLIRLRGQQVKRRRARRRPAHRLGDGPAVSPPIRPGGEPSQR